MVTIVEEDEVMLFWNNRQVRCEQHLVAQWACTEI
jgi:hypothetical protein